MWIVQIALRRPYTFVVFAFFIAIFGGLAALRTPVDIFPNINIPVVSVVWTYNGLAPNDMSSRVIYYYERTLTSQVGDIEHIEFAVAQQLRRRQNLLPEERQHRRGAGAGDGGFADRAETAAARHHAALRAQLQRLQCADPAAGALEQEAAADATVRPRAELHPAAARHRRRRRDPLPLRRQDPAGSGRSRSAGHAGSQCFGRRRPQCRVVAESHPACRRPENRQIRLERVAQRQPDGARKNQ